VFPVRWEGDVLECIFLKLIIRINKSLIIVGFNRVVVEKRMFQSCIRVCKDSGLTTVEVGALTFRAKVGTEIGSFLYYEETAAFGMSHGDKSRLTSCIAASYQHQHPNAHCSYSGANPWIDEYRILSNPPRVYLQHRERLAGNPSRQEMPLHL
jgi:hypothetical protein